MSLVIFERAGIWENEMRDISTDRVLSIRSWLSVQSDTTSS